MPVVCTRRARFYPIKLARRPLGVRERFVGFTRRILSGGKAMKAAISKQTPQPANICAFMRSWKWTAIITAAAVPQSCGCNAATGPPLSSTAYFLLLSRHLSPPRRSSLPLRLPISSGEFGLAEHQALTTSAPAPAAASAGPDKLPEPHSRLHTE
ncbi:unnamed protein product [Pleuronectes platessa]|uniref:Uncharacterized protein n=1 Tax=Pleuronectes platessa TaxID=8262 RepID=A0A9N7VAW8_PLEPL|nr:unnamed protein product [Pleuronectes platessa]